MQPLPIDAKKTELRRQILAQRKNLSSVQRKLWDESLLQHLVEREEYHRCRLLLAYYPIRDEVDTLPIVHHAYADGKAIAFPRSNRDTHTLTFHAVDSLDDLIKGAYRIPEPPTHIPPITDFSGALCLVPALSFDRNGFRLGYGGGFYDRFLADFDGSSAGLCYEVLLSDSLPRCPTDRSVQLILTEKGEVP